MSLSSRVAPTGLSSLTISSSFLKRICRLSDFYLISRLVIFFLKVIEMLTFFFEIHSLMPSTYQKRPFIFHIFQMGICNGLDQYGFTFYIRFCKSFGITLIFTLCWSRNFQWSKYFPPNWVTPYFSDFDVVIFYFVYVLSLSITYII